MMKSCRSFASFASPLHRLFEQVQNKHLSIDQAVKAWRKIECLEIEQFAQLDGDRLDRTGFPEVVYGEGKTPEQILQIFQNLQATGEGALATRISAEKYQQLLELAPEISFKYYATPRILTSISLPQHQRKQQQIAVLCAGTSDLGIAEEAAVTAELAQYQVIRIYDIGVAGIHRLLRKREEIDQADVVICVAGMDGALPGVVAGLTKNPVIAVPTNVGYGAAFGGVAPLLTMLNACSPGVGVVNIDNGFGAAVLAGRILNGHKQSNDDNA